MSCHGCASKFSLFLKESSCPNCKFSFCSKCLKEKVTVNCKQQKICCNCYKKLTDHASIVKTPEVEPPALLLRRLESLENPGKPPITVFKQSNKFSDLRSGLSKEDQQIIERLEKLKENRNLQEAPSEQEIKRRLAVLKGKDETTCSKVSNLPKESKKSEQEQIEDLLKLCAEETAIDQAYESDFKLSIEDLEKRFQNLKHGGAPLPALSSKGVLGDEDGVAVTSKIIKRALEEAKLEKKFENKASSMEEDCSEEEINELPWCIICNENATVKCLDCDNSLYCSSCFKEGHDYFEMKNHETEPFSSKHESE